jgi:hypothetical protein
MMCAIIPMLFKATEPLLQLEARLLDISFSRNGSHSLPLKEFKARRSHSLVEVDDSSRKDQSKEHDSQSPAELGNQQASSCSTSELVIASNLFILPLLFFASPVAGAIQEALRKGFSP